MGETRKTIILTFCFNLLHDAPDLHLQQNPDGENKSVWVQTAMDRIRRFFTRRYFRGLWVVQEMYHAKNGVLQCGSNTIPWQTFQRGMDRLRKAGTPALANGRRGFHLIELLDQTMVERIARLLRFPKTSAYFIKCIELCHSAECQDDRDRVFALSSMNSSDWPQPDYSLSVSETYTRFSRSCIEHRLCESILFHAAQQLASATKKALRDHLVPTLPSWAIDCRDLGGPGMHSFWQGPKTDHQHSPGAKVDEYDRLFCTLPVLGILRSSDQQGNVWLTSAALNASSADLKMPDVHRDLSRIGDHCLFPADVLCRIRAREVFAGGHKELEYALIFLRPVALDSKIHTLVALTSERAIGPHLEPDILSSGIERRRFCIV